MHCCLAGGTELKRYDARVAKCVADERIDSSKVTSGKNHFHEMNGDVGMAGWK